MDKPTYAEMEAFLDKYAEHADISGVSMDTQGMLVQMYEIVKRLMADVQELQQERDTRDSMLDTMPDYFRAFARDFVEALKGER